MLESLTDLVTSSDWVYLLIVGVAALDAIFPLVPSEATVIAAAALAGSGELALPLVLLAGVAGAVAGDNVAYLLGRAGQGLLLRRVFGSSAWRHRVERAQDQLLRRGATIIAVSRFVPGGRTATMLSAGLVGLDWRRFAAYDLLAGVLWASYATGIGWIGGKAFEGRPLHALLLGFAVAAAFALLVEGGRRWLRRGLPKMG